MAKLNVTTLIIFSLFFVSCSTSSVKRKKKDYPKIISSLQEDVSVLKKENSDLKSEIRISREEALKDKSYLNKRLDKTNGVIDLLEKNLTLLFDDKRKEEKKRASIEKKEKESKPVEKKEKNIKEKQESEEDPYPYEKEILTPSDSKAVDEVLLHRQGNEKLINKNRKIDIKSEKKVKLSEEVVKKAISDPDLEEPHSPFQLSVEYGAKILYNKAYKDFSAGNYKKSISLFNDFLREFPNDSDSDNAQFWIGYSHLKMKKSIQAEEAFRRVLRNYKHGLTVDGFKAADAVLMIGRIYLGRRKVSHARYYFKHIVKNYKSTRAAYKAKLELDSLISLGAN